MRNCYSIFIVLLLVFSCKDHAVEQVVPIDHIDTSGISISYSFKNKTYTKKFPLWVMKKGFTTKDSMLVRIDRADPKEVAFKSIIYSSGH